ncbi:ankyrin repeat domain-containing protein [Myxococcota bacterium]
MLIFIAGSAPGLEGESGPEPCCLVSAVQAGDLETVRSLLDAGAEVDTRNRRNETPLHTAAMGGQGKIVDLLLERGAPVDVQANKTLWTPLHILACAGDQAGIALSLVKAGADPNARDRWGRTPLHWFAMDGDCEAVDVLIDAGADPDAQDLDGFTPLHRVAMQGHGCASTLLRKGADVHNRSPRTGWTPLHCSAYGKGYKVARQLLMAGADLFARDHEYRTVADMAAYTSNRDLQRFLKIVLRNLAISR